MCGLLCYEYLGALNICATLREIEHNLLPISKLHNCQAFQSLEYKLYKLNQNSGKLTYTCRYRVNTCISDLIGFQDYSLVNTCISDLIGFQDYSLVELDVNSSEFVTIQCLFIGKMKCAVKKIFRVQNHKLWEKYSV